MQHGSANGQLITGSAQTHEARPQGRKAGNPSHVPTLLKATDKGRGLGHGSMSVHAVGRLVHLAIPLVDARPPVCYLR